MPTSTAPRTSFRILTGLLVALAVLAGACSSASKKSAVAASGGGGGAAALLAGATFKVGSKDFSEQFLLAQMAMALLEQARPSTRQT